MNRKKIEFFKHNLEKIDITSCQKVLNSIFLTSGEVTKQFEDKLRKLVGSKYAVGVTSCTDALFLSLKYFGIKKGDEVITSPLSFVSTANVIEHCGAKPVFVDVELDTGNIDANLLEKHINKNTKAIIPVHLYGQMCDMSKIRKIAKKHKISVVEDSAHCLEGSRNGFKPGMLSDMACFSFYTTKTLTCGEGGAIACNNKDIYEWLIRARLHGINKSAADRYTKLYQHYDMEFLGYKCNLTNISSSLLINQIERVIKYKRQR
jgi:dTDP-4-amino-4,6-dideoxygalactose transaminase